MATRKIQHEQALAKRARRLEAEKREGQIALTKDRNKRLKEALESLDNG